MALETKEDPTYKRMRLTICSANRKFLLFSLNEHKKSLGELREESCLDSATIVHALRELERYHMVKQDTRSEYSLTVIGRAMVQKVMECRCMAEVLTLHEVFWSQHDVSGIPSHWFNELGMLRDSTLVTSTQQDILKAYDTFVALMQEGNRLKLISSVYSPELVKRLDAIIPNKKVTYFVITDDVWQRAVRETGSEYVERLVREGLRISIIAHDPKFALVSTNSAMGLALFDSEGSLDYSQLLVSRSNEAVMWGRELFYYYLERSESITLTDERFRDIQAYHI